MEKPADNTSPGPDEGSKGDPQGDLGFGSSEAGALGGKARAKRLTKEQRSEIARKGGLAKASLGKQEEKLPKAICGGSTPLRLGNLEIPCYVLEEGAVPEDEDRRVITASGLLMAIGMQAGGGSTRLGNFAVSVSPNSAAANDLTARLNSPIEFVMPQGGVAKGYSALLLLALCDVILEARKNGKLGERYTHIAQAAENVVRGLANVGIIALVDEATGFEKVRKRMALADVLDKYLSDKLNFWTKTFPDEFYEEYFRLQSWDNSKLRAGDGKPAEIGKFTRDVVYRRLHPWIVRELEEKNPCIVPGRRMYKHHMWLSQELGHPALKEHLAKIITIMKLSSDMLDFNQKVTKVLGQPGDQGFFDEFFKDDDKKR